MKTLAPLRNLAVFLAMTVVVVAPAVAAPAQAQDRRAVRENDRDRARFQTQHWRWDNRYNHNHYYPAVGYTVQVLPSGHIAVNHRGSRYFLQSGVWFHLNGGRYMVVRPPLGLIAPVLPTGYTTVSVAGVPYYYANDVYYASAPNGYTVVAPPEDAYWQSQAPQQPQHSAGAPEGNVGNPAQPAPGAWYYCDSAKAYYPYIAACNEGWRTVPAAPPPQ